MNRNCKPGYTNWNCNRTRRLDQGMQIMLPPWRCNKTIYTMYTSLAGHNRPFSTVPFSPPRLGRSGLYTIGVGKWTIDLGVFTFTVTAVVSIFASGPAALTGVKPWLETLSESCWTREMTSRLNDKQLILGQIGPTMRVSCAQHHLKNSKGFRPSQNVFYFHLPATVA